MNITQKDIDDLVYNFKWSKENFKDKKVTDIYRQGIYDVVELLKKKEQPFNKERLMEVAKPETPEEKAEAEERKHLRKRYERISNSDWFKKTHVGISIGEQPLEKYVAGIGELGKVWDEQAIISRLDRIIELLERPIIMPFSQPIQPLQPIYYDTNKVYCSTASTEGGEK